MRVFLKHITRFGFVLIFLAGFVLLQTQGSAQPQSAKPDSASATPQSEAGAASGNKADSNSYLIGVDDVLAISVWQEPDLTRSLPVRSDGKISLPLVGEIQAAGETPLQLQRNITEGLKSYMTAPTVTVIVQEINSKKFNILGQVAKPGSYSLSLASTVMDAIALAGGFRDFAKKKDISILRPSANKNNSDARFHFNYKDFIKGKNPAQNIRLEPNDTIIVH